MKEEIKNKNIIIAPHCDDEIIGCYEIIDNPDNPPVILYVDSSLPQYRRGESLKLREHTGVTIQIFCKSIPPIFLNPSNTIYAPDPIYETHPLHRLWGSQAENYLRQGLDIIFYNTTMSAPYINETKKPEEKEALLNLIYPSQKSLWKYEKKYILYSGYCKWLMNGVVGSSRATTTEKQQSEEKENK